jgi:hypothetical protein
MDHLDYLFLLLHLGICLALVLEDGIPSWKESSVLRHIRQSMRLTEVGRPSGTHNSPLCTTSPPVSEAITRSTRNQVLLTLVLPWKRIGSSPGPRQKANVQTASAPRSSNESSILFKPSWPSASRNDLLACVSFVVPFPGIGDVRTCTAPADPGARGTRARCLPSEQGR